MSEQWNTLYAIKMNSGLTFQIIIIFLLKTEVKIHVKQIREGNFTVNRFITQVLTLLTQINTNGSPP